MTNNTRLIVNTMAQNFKTILNIFLSLYSTRIVIGALGESDYGIYMLVAGIVSLLSYLSNTLVITTQRHLSFSAGAGKSEEVRLLFANSYMLHWLLGLVLALVCLSMTNLVFDHGMLNIQPDKIGESKIVYAFVVISVLLTFITSPYKALLIAHENIVYISVVDVLDGVLKLGLVFALYWVEEWRLATYSVIMASIMLFHFFMLMGYCLKNYSESIFLPHLHLWNNQIQRQIIGFATWTLYGMLCVYVRTQGVAVLVNKMFGTVANAAFGIATQVFGSLQFFSQAIINAISPQIIKAEGANDRTRSIRLSFQASKYCYLILSLAVIPLSFELPTILSIWLTDVPALSVEFCLMMLVSALADQITTGLGTLNQAIGKLRTYTLICYTAKILVIPVSIFLMKQGTGWEAVVICYFVFELLSAVVRIPLLVHTAHIRIKDYLLQVPLRVLFPTLVMVSVGYLMVNYTFQFDFRFLLTGIACVVSGIVAILFTSLDKSEKIYLSEMIIHKHKK